MRKHSRATPPPKKTDRFSDFFRNASPKEKIKVFKKAAKKANQDQRAVFKRAKIKLSAA